MPQKTNLNVSPYYDDFDKDDNFYRVLFKPGFPVQARELTGLQSILQNQIESFGSHLFKEGSMVIPGGITCDNSFTSIIVENDHLGIDVTVYLDALVSANNGRGTLVTGEDSGVVGRIKGYILPPEEGVENITLFVKYRDSGSDGETVQFQDGEVLVLSENLTYGNTTLNSGDTIVSLVSTNASRVGYSVGVAKGVYFIRGTFVDVPTSQIVLDPYTTEVSYRVGFDILEEIVSSDDNPKLNDNAKGFTNYAAPGADRLKISVRLAKKQLLDYDDTNFVELVRVDNGEIKRIQNSSEYSVIKDYFAKRTFDESGDYAVDSFKIDVVESLNDETGNGGIYREDQLTEQGNVPTENLMSVRMSSGTAYVRGYDVNLVGSTVIDVEKPRTTKKIDGALIPFGMGSLLKVNNVFGVPYINIGDPVGSGSNVISLYNKLRNTGNTTTIGNNAIKIGEARVYWYGVSDAPYSGATTTFDLYIYDIQTYTTLHLAKAYTNADVPLTSFVRGLSSGATGYIESKPNHVGAVNISQTSGTFLVGEQVIINDDPRFKTSIGAINAYSVEDIKSVHQDSNTLNTALQTDFMADAVLHGRIPPNFSAVDKLTVSGGNTGKVSGKFFNAVTGIKTDAILKYQSGNDDPNYNIITSIAANGSSIGLAQASATSTSGIFTNSVTNGDSQFALMVPKILNLNSSGLFAQLPEGNIASVDLGDSDLVISRQLTGKSTSATGSLSLQVSDAIDVAAGINSVFYETFDAERYSIHYDDGTTETLTSDQFTLGANGGSITFNNLNVNESNVTVCVTLKKKQVTNKTKNFVRSKQVSVVRTSGISTVTGLSTSPYYGLRVEDQEISLNTADVCKIRAVYESTNISAPVLDKLTFSTGLALDVNAITGEKIVGQTSRAIGQVVNKTATTIDYVPLNENEFQVGEFVKFNDSSISAAIQETTSGSYVDKTSNYFLNKGHKNQFLDYSRIVRRPGSAVPSKQLLIIFDAYEVSAGSTGDIFTVNSYTAERYKNDIPSIPNGTRSTDLLDFRPRVADFDASSATASPFAFSSRTYDSTYRYVVKPDETSFIGYSYYLPRVDLLSVNRFGEVEITKGEPSDTAQAPILADDAMEVAQLRYPPYLYNTSDIQITLRDNRRFTMRDIAKLEDRIENLEEVTSLSMLELNAKTLQVTDANGLDRFKSGFIVTDFKDKSLSDPKYTTIDIDKENSIAISPVDFWSLPAELALDTGIDKTKADVTQNLKLLDPNIQKSGDLLTLKFEEVNWLEQPHATGVENVNPFNVTVFVGGVILDPAADNWATTIYINGQRTESTGAKWVQEASVKKDYDYKTEYVTYKKGGGRGEKKTKAVTVKTTTTTTTYKPKLTGPSREFDYVENIKVKSFVDPFMRSRNVYFAANGLKPFTKHYHYLDSQQVDIIPKVCEITMKSGTFTVFEDIDVFHGNKKIGLMRVQKPNHKFGDTSRPDIAAGLGSPSTYVEEYSVDPYDKTRPAPGAAYSATSKLINIDVRSLANQQKYYGYLPVGSEIVGRTSGAVATISKADLITDNWGDCIASFFFRDPNTTPQPPVKVKSGTKTVKVTAVPPGVTPTPGSAQFQSEAFGTYSGSGTVTVQATMTVSVRNPPMPKPNPTTVTKAVHRDPLAQTFTVDGKGAFLSSFDLYFASKDDEAKVFVELRTVELGTPTAVLVQDYCQVALNPNDIKVSDDASLATNVKFSSPVYLEADKEYAIVILAPSSDAYELWTATMGEATVQTQNLPNVQNVIVTKQYIGGSLFKSQNGTIWTPSQYQDLTFKLYKAKFVSSGTLTFYNTDITPGGTNVAVLQNNPIEGLPRKLKLPISGTLDAAVQPGVKIGEGTSPSITGIVENLGGPISTSTLVSVGSGYPTGTFTGVELYSISGKGTGAEASITFASGSISSFSVTANGNGYVEGEVLGITTSSISSGSVSGAGVGGQIGVQNIGSTDTIYLTNVQGDNFTNTRVIQYYEDPNLEITRTSATATVNGTSSLVDSKYSGNVFRVKQYNHAHHGGNNKIEIVNIKPDREKVKLTEEFGLNDTSVSVANTSIFATFEGITTSRGYALIQNEVVSYTNIIQGSGGAGTLTIDSRGLNGSVSIPHAKDVDIQPYEVNGVSLMRLNNTFDIPSTYYSSENSNIDNYFLEFDRTSPTPRNSGSGFLNFESTKGVGGNSVGISQNHQFSSIEPLFNVITPGKGTAVQALIRTTSGTSAGGTEVSFLDQGYEPIALNRVLHFNTPRMVASRINETTRLTTLPLNKSLTMRVNFSTDDENLSPVMDIQNSTFVLGRNRSNSPIDNYVTDPRSNATDGDPHAAVFVTKGISLEQPATSLKVIVAANRQEDADFRVFYKLYKADSTEIDQGYIPFPGWENMKDTDGDGFGDEIINENANTGSADAFVTANDSVSFSEYQFTANNLDQFEGFAIKIVMSSKNESTPVRLKDFRCIALA